MSYWLVKSEPDVFSFDDLMKSEEATTRWDGIRNFAARNFMRDGMKKGDRVFFYHSGAKPPAIVGICEVVREAYVDPTALDPKHPQYDASAKNGASGWVAVDLRGVQELARPVTLPELKAEPKLARMSLLRIGRLSVSPVSSDEWKTIMRMAK